VFLKNTYIEKRMLDYHTNQLFSARQDRSESISDWIQKIQRLWSKFREAALHDCKPGERARILTITDKLRNICFVQGLYLDRIQTIMRSQNPHNFDEIAETALKEESAIVSKFDWYKSLNMQLSSFKCSNCGKGGHMASRSYLRERKAVRVN
jgi:hypothetical protein